VEKKSCELRVYGVLGNSPPLPPHQRAIGSPFELEKKGAIE
jgi:hypothetical protein